ncbi:MAG: CerR family C-terminal domain-containing protein [Gammaproteobacteria bacterium]|nr:CerR family C-terminal domain-containing protein [Gammaproteobacteria bacterium]
MATKSQASTNTDSVRQRLLEVAAKRFAESGFADISVRDITAAADCNVAAVNYYFGSKDQLYLEVFRLRFAELRERRVGALKALMDRGDLSLEVVLRTFANAFLEPLMEDGRGRLTMKLIMREMVDRYVPKEMIVEEMIRPTMNALLEALRKVCPDLKETHACLCIHSLVAQLIHILQVQELYDNGDEGVLAHHDIGDAVNHIVLFTAYGMRAYTDQSS